MQRMTYLPVYNVDGMLGKKDEFKPCSRSPENTPGEWVCNLTRKV